MPTVYPDNRLWGQPDGTYVGYTLSTNNGIQTLNMTDDLYFRKDSAALGKISMIDFSDQVNRL